MGELELADVIKHDSCSGLRVRYRAFEAIMKSYLEDFLNNFDDLDGFEFFRTLNISYHSIESPEHILLYLVITFSKGLPLLLNR